MAEDLNTLLEGVDDGNGNIYVSNANVRDDGNGGLVIVVTDGEVVGNRSFSFCGVDVLNIGLHYAPENQYTYIYNPSEVNVNVQTFDGRHGGYYYGETVKPKVFTLRCYYEDTAVDKGLLTKARNLFKRGRSGKLVFGSKPWLYYNCTVTNFDADRMLNRRNGFVTIQLTAFWPFGFTDYDCLEDYYGNDMIDNSGILPEDLMPDREFNSVNAASTILLYNGGTEYARCSIDIAGNVGSGLTLFNRTTNQECGFKGLNAGSATKYVHLDGINGSCYWVSNDSDNNKPAFIYHDYGFIDLAPNSPIRDIVVSGESGTNTLTIDGIYADETLIGQYIYCDGKYRKIVNVTDGDEIVVNSNLSNTVSDEDTIITDLNEIVLTPTSTVDLSLLRFDYKHTFA